jgi:hypothetical protein
VGQHVTANAGSGPNEKGGPKAAPGPIAGARSDRAGTEPHRGGVHRHALEDVFGAEPFSHSSPWKTFAEATTDSFASKPIDDRAGVFAMRSHSWRCSALRTSKRWVASLSPHLSSECSTGILY